LTTNEKKKEKKKRKRKLAATVQDTSRKIKIERKKEEKMFL